MAIQPNSKALAPRSHRCAVSAPAGRRAIIAAGGLCASLLAFAFSASPAFADRAFDSQITGFSNPWGLTIDSADNVWVSDPGNGGLISEYDGYPSQTKIGEQTGAGHYGATYIRSLAVNSSNGYLYVADSGPEVIDVFDPVSFLSQWGVGGGYVYVAADNSGGSSNGRVYVAEAFGGVVAFDANHNPANFSASSESYIHENEITGTPGGAFGRPWNIAVDGEGDIYVVDEAKGQVDEFKASGEFVQAFTGAGAPGGFSGELSGVAIDPTNGNVLVIDASSNVVDEFSASGEYLDQLTEAGEPSAPFGRLNGGIAVNSQGYVYIADGGNHAVDIFQPNVALPKATYAAVTEETHTSGKLHATIDPNGGGNVISCRFEYGTSTSYGLGSVPCSPDPAHEPPTSNYTEPTEVSTEIAGLSPGTTYHYRVVAANANGAGRGKDHTFTPQAVYGLNTNPATGLTANGATLTGSFTGEGIDTTYYFEYGTTELYEQTTPTEDGGSGAGPQTVAPVTIGELQGFTIYHYRIVATNSFGTTYGPDRTFETTEVPAIDGVYSSNLGPTTAHLHARINPNGLATTYHFEYGTTTNYGASDPVPGEDVGAGLSGQTRTVHLSGLQEGVVYHFRVVATSSDGTTTSEDQTFNFFPSHCPNASLRQQTGAEYLPDCRAYELVSPSNAGNVIFFPGFAPAAPYAENPARFAFTGGLGAVSGTNPTDTNFDTYVATRTDTGWVTKYVGIKGSEHLGSTDTIGDLSFDKFIDFDGGGGFVGEPQPPSNAPYVWDENGDSLGRWPADVTELTNGDATEGAFQPSADFTHLAFSSKNVDFVPGGLTTAPGSAYDYNTATGSTEIISKTPDGKDIPAQTSEEFIEIPPINSSYGLSVPSPESNQSVPGVSTNGSHILMSTSPQENRSCFYGCAPYPVRLYMRVDDAVTYDVSAGHNVIYVGMTADGSKVFFTSEEPLVTEDQDTSPDLYMWSEATNSLTLISKGNNGTGNSDACGVSWTTKCGVIPAIGARSTDNEIASESGEIYFYSPEQLDRGKGVAGQENLYVYRNGQAHFVASLTPGDECGLRGGEETVCAGGPLARIQVSSDGSHAAFVTASQLTSANTAGFEEMYSYEPSSGKIVCASCNPNGEPPTGNVEASEDGLFMSNDGRTFFYSPDALVPQDTDKLHDVYEFVEGRPQLITTGTGSEDTQTTANQIRAAGFEGVSAEGTNVYFSTYDTLVGQDDNGQFLKFYDARTDGGFPFVPAPAPCSAADECHGAGSAPPASPAITSGSGFGSGGNVHLKAKRAKNRHRRKPHGKRVRNHKRHPNRRTG